MKYYKYEMGSYNLHIINTDLFKENHVSIKFKRKAIKDEITIRNLLCDILTFSSKKYPKNRDMLKETQELYRLRYSGRQVLSGNYSIMDFTISFLNEKYTEDGMFDKSIDFLMELILNPNIENNEFDLNSFNIVKDNLQKYISQLQENPKAYSITRMLEESDDSSPLSYRSDGYLEDLDKITPASLYQYYLQMLQKDVIDIFVVGNIDPSSIKKKFMDNFKIKTIKKPAETHILAHKKIRKRAKIVKEKSKNNQSKLAIGLKLDPVTPFEMQYVLSIYTYILGLGPDSKLFKIIREKHSLCYNIKSAYYKPSNLIVIDTGISNANYNKALRLIRKQLKEMEKGNFTEQDINNAKIIYKGALEEAYDSIGSIASTYVSNIYLGFDLPEVRIKNIDKVTKDMIVNISRKIHLDTIFLLEGDDKSE